MKQILRTLQAALILSLVLFFQHANAQVQTAKHISSAANSNGYYEYLPQGYSSGNETYPLLIFVHGLGETGDGSPSSLPKVANVGVPKVIREGNFPASFYVNGQTHKFIVISPQFSSWPNFVNIQSVINYAVQNYRVNTNRIYLTGLSMGGGITWEYAGYNSTYAKTLAAIVPVCGASWPDLGRAKVIAASGLAVWATHNVGDDVAPVSYTNGYVDNINAQYQSPGAKKTIFQVGGHDAWSTTYNPAFKENGMNIYEWMLQFSRGAATTPPPPQPVANKAPVVSAGSNITLTLPSNSVTLNPSGSDADGYISQINWSKVAGPSQFSINNAAIANPVISNLVAGTYIIRLTVSDNLGATATSDVSITVNAPAVTNLAPVISAGANITLNAPANSITLSPNGYDPDGQIVRVLWTKIAGPSQFNISDPNTAFPVVSNLVAGTYTLRLTVADDKGATATSDVNITVNATSSNKPPVVSAGPAITLSLPLNSTTMAPTGHDPDGHIAKCEWSKVSGPNQIAANDAYSPFPTISNLVAGTYVLRLTVTDNQGATASSDVTITVRSSAGSSTTQAGALTESAQNAAAKTFLQILPNPVVSSFILKLDNEKTGTMKVHIIDLSGRVRKEFVFSKTQRNAQFNLSAGELSAGSYMLRVQIGDWTDSEKFIKL